MIDAMRVSAFVVLFASSAVAASPADDAGFILQSDLIGRLNPDGILLRVGAVYRLRFDDKPLGQSLSYGQLGLSVGASPAYGQVSLHAEAAPFAWLVLRGQYDLYTFFGAFGSLLNFESAGASFSRDTFNKRSGEEKLGVGHRMLASMTLRAKLGRVVFRNQTSAMHFWFSGGGPFVYEFEFDALMQTRDVVVTNRVQVMWEFWRGQAPETLLFGPAYQFDRTFGSSMNRHRVGAIAFWIPKRSAWIFNRPRVFAYGGVNLESAQRQRQPFILFGVGSDVDL